MRITDTGRLLKRYSEARREARGSGQPLDEVFGRREESYARMVADSLERSAELKPLRERAGELRADGASLSVTRRELLQQGARVSAGLTTAGPLHGSLSDESPERKLLKDESITRLLGALAGLSDRQRKLVRGYYFEGRSLDDIAGELGISKSWASRLHTGALAELRSALEA